MKFICSILLVSSVCFGSLCDPKNISKTHKSEIQNYLESMLSIGEYKGVKNYSLHVLGCNRKKDSNGEYLDESDLNFKSELPEKEIRGTIKYLNIKRLPYSYKLRRESGKWIVETAALFTKKIGKYSDISRGLAKKLGVFNDPKYCLKSVYKNKRLVRGRTESENSCRLNAKEKIDGMTVEEHSMVFWKETIEDYWSNEFVEFRFHILNLDAEAIERFGKNYWKVNWNNRISGRATYYPIPFKWFPIYMGENARTIVHEFGHWMGLDDEYPEFLNKRTPTWKKCKEVGGEQYIMCLSKLSPIPKGIYHWIITRRYSVGE